MRSKTWSDAEIETFSLLCIEKQIPTLMDGGRFRIIDVYKEMEEKMSKQSYVL